MIRVKEMNFWVLGLFILIGFHLFILSKLVFFPYPELFIYSYLTDQGLLPYKQIFDQHFPGLMFFPVNLHTLGMTTPQVARIWHFGVVAITHIILFLVGKKLFKSEKWALFTNFLYLMWQPFFEGYVLWIDTFVPIFLLGAFYFLFLWKNREKSKFLFWSGFLLGVALLLKQVTAPLIALSGLMIWWKNKLPGANKPWYSRPSGSTSLFTASIHPRTKSSGFFGSLNRKILFVLPYLKKGENHGFYSWMKPIKIVPRQSRGTKRDRVPRVKPVVIYFAGVGLPVVFMVIYIVSIGVWQDFIYWTATFNLTIFAQMGRKFPDVSGLARASPVFGMAGIAAVFYYHKRKSLNIFWLGAFFFTSLAYAYARFDYIHLQPALPFALLILTYSFIRLPKRLFKIVILGFLAISAFLIFPFYRVNSGSRVLFFGQLERNIATKVEELTETSDKVFAFGTTPHLYQLTNRLPPGNIFVFQFPWFMVIAENMVLSGIINDPPKLVVRDKSAKTGGENLINYMSNINQFIDENYQLVDKVDGIEIMLMR